MANIYGGVTSINNPRTNWAQTDAKKADYLKNKPSVANALKGHKIGQSIRVDDLSPLEHELEAKVSSKNLWDATKHNHRLHGGARIVSDFIKVKKNTNYIITVDNSETTKWAIKGWTEEQISECQALTTQAEQISYIWNKGTVIVSNRNAFNSGDFEYITGRMWNDFSTYGITPESNFQLEEGTTATPFTPFVEVEGTEVKQLGKNLCTLRNVNSSGRVQVVDDMIIITQIDEGNGYTGILSNKGTGNLRVYELCPDLKVGDRVMMYFDISCTIGTPKQFMYFGGWEGTPSKTWQFTKEGAITVDETFLNATVVFYASGNIGDVTTISNIRFEIGETVSEYEPYKEPISATVDAEGNAEGLMFAPSMTLTGVEGTVIEFNYNRDASKVITDLETKLNTLIATIGG